MKNIYKERLLKFADYISQFTKNTPHPEMGLTEEVELIALEEKVRIHYKILFHTWIFEELPGCFDEWFYDEHTGNTLYENCDPEASTVGAVIDFFKLDQDEFCHLFDIEGSQLCDRFGGQLLSIDSQGIDVAQNIVEFVKSKEKTL